MIRFNFGTVRPSFMIIGVQKGGTSSLFHYLSQHPQIIAPKEKELHYFDTKDATPDKPYLNLFPKSYFTRKLSFDATPRYIYYPGTAKRIYSFDSAMKFIVILRDPVERAYSAWNMYKQMKDVPKWQNQFYEREQKDNHEKLHTFFIKNEFPTFEEWVELELSKDFDDSIIEPSVVRRGYYKDQIEEFLKYFNRESFLFLDFEMFKNDIQSTLIDVTNFLKIHEFNESRLNLKPKNVRAYGENASQEIKMILRNHYRIKNDGLQEFIGLKLNWLNK